MPRDLMAGHGEITLGFNAYCWGGPYQDALLGRRVLPLFQRLGADCGLRRVWYDRATLRGPHILGLATVPSDREERARDLIHEALTQALHEQPSRETLTARELETFHFDAGGKALCDADLDEGMAANNSFTIFVHHGAETRYPFFLWKCEEDGPFWRTSASLAMFTLRQFAAKKPGVQVNNMALAALLAFNETFFSDSEEARQYWTFHIGTLIPNLDVSRLDSRHVQGLLSKTMSPESLALIREWHGGHPEKDLGSDYAELKECFRQLHFLLGALAGRSRSAARELLHVLLKQLGISTLRQIPMIFSLLSLSYETREPAGHLRDK